MEKNLDQKILVIDEDFYENNNREQVLEKALKKQNMNKMNYLNVFYQQQKMQNCYIM